MDEAKIHELAFRVVGDMAGTFAMGMGYVGDKLGLFKALAGAGPMTSTQLAEKTSLNERYVREWGKGMVAAEYIDYDADTESFVMTDEQAAVLTNEEFPFFVGGAFHFTPPSLYNLPAVIECFKNGGGVPYCDLGDEIPHAIERFFGPGYRNFLAKDWLGAVPGALDKLTAGGKVADVGCGCGQSTVTMAKAYPESTFVGIDVDASSLERAKKLAADSGVSNVEWRQGPAHEQLTEGEFDLVCAFDCVHDMVDPVGTLRAAKGALREGGSFFMIEPNASHNPLENRNPVGKAYANVSPVHCMTVSLAHEGAGLGTTVGEHGARNLSEQAGFGSFQKLPVEHPFCQLFVLTP